MNDHEGCVPPEMAQTPYGMMPVAPAIHTPACLLKAWGLIERMGK